MLVIAGQLDSPALAPTRYRWVGFTILGFVLRRLGCIRVGWVGFAVVGLCSLSLANRHVRLVCHCVRLGHASPRPPPRVVSSSSSSSLSSCRLLLLLLVLSLPPPPRVVSSSSSSSASCRLPRGMISLCCHASCRSSSSPCVISSLCVVLIVSSFILSFIVLGVCRFPPNYSVEHK